MDLEKIKSLAEKIHNDSGWLLDDAKELAELVLDLIKIHGVDYLDEVFNDNRISDTIPDITLTPEFYKSLRSSDNEEEAE